MKNKLKKIFIIVGLVILSMFTLLGCSNEDKSKTLVNEYAKIWNEKNYEAIYESLSKESKEYVNKEYKNKDGFIEKYTNIYSGIGVNNVKVKIKESEDKSFIPIDVTMNTIGGELKFENVKVNYVKEDKEYKIVWDENLIIPGMITGDEVRYSTSKANRGRILDRNDELLAYNGEVNSLYVHPKVFEVKKEENISQLANILDISEEYIIGKLEKNQKPDDLLHIVKIANYEQEKIDLAKVIEGVSIRKEISRVYKQGEAFGNLIGYTGNITKEELEKNEDKGYTAHSQIGKQGLEKTYEDKLRAKEGVHIYIKRGEEKITLAKTEASDGEDIKLAIDSSLQENVYAQMNNEKGASIAMDPKTGEVLAMVSSPSYDSNMLVTYKTKTIAQRWKDSEDAEFKNRANNVYSPGSTMKLITAAIGLDNNVINPNEGMNINGRTWQKDGSWGNYKITRVKDTNGPVNLYDAVKYSDNIYFGDKAIKIGEEKFIEGVKKFGIGEDVPFEYPMDKSKVSVSGKLEKEILLADSGYGQGEVLVSPLDITMAYSALGNEGKIMVPRLVISENNEAKVYKEAINPANVLELIRCFSGVINDSDGSGYQAKIEGINLAGKTGTAEIKKSKDDKTGTENGWFVAVNTDNPKIAVSLIMEDTKDKSSSGYIAPKVKNIIEGYLYEE